MALLREGGLGFDMTQQRVDVLTHIMGARTIAKIFSALVVVLQRKRRDILQIGRIKFHAASMRSANVMTMSIKASIGAAHFRIGFELLVGISWLRTSTRFSALKGKVTHGQRAMHSDAGR